MVNGLALVPGLPGRSKILIRNSAINPSIFKDTKKNNIQFGVDQKRILSYVGQQTEGPKSKGGGLFLLPYHKK